VGGLLLEYGLDEFASRRRDGAEHISQFDATEVVGDAVGELREQYMEGGEGQERVARASLDGVKGEPNLEGQVLGLPDSGLDQALKFGRREGMGICAVLEGIQIAGRGACATGTEFGVAVSATPVVVAHCPVLAAGYGAACLVQISGHILFPLSLF
jgi:hypothetical protein